MITQVRNAYRRFKAIRRGYDVYKNTDAVWVVTHDVAAGSDMKMPLECAEDLRKHTKAKLGL